MTPVLVGCAFAVGGLGVEGGLTRPGLTSLNACRNEAEGSGSLTRRYSSTYLEVGGTAAYVIQNNVWNPTDGRQTIRFTGASFEIVEQTHGSPGGGSPISFPSIYVGSNGRTATEDGRLPRQLGQIESIPTCLAWSGGDSTDQFNVAYDVWVSDSERSPRVPNAYLMIWYRKPSEYNPAGGLRTDSTRIGGQDWQVWQGPNHAGTPVVSYVHLSGSLPSYEFDLKNFLDDAIRREYLRSDQYLSAVMAGVEIWGGGVGVSIDGFAASVNE